MSKMMVIDYLRAVSPEKKSIKQISAVLGVGVQSIHANVKKMCRDKGVCSDLDRFEWVLEDYNGIRVRKYFFVEKKRGFLEKLGW